MTQTVPDISPLMPMHQDPLLVQLTCGPSYGIRAKLPSTKSSRWLTHITLLIFRYVIIITRVSELIMFSPCVFVCLWLGLCLYHDVCPDDLTMKDWCHTNNILQVHCWGCVVVQVRFHALMTSSMTSPGHKVGQILKVIYIRQYLS